MVGHGQFIRKQAGKNHLNRKMRASHKARKRKPVFATVTHRRLLRKLVPYWKKKYSRQVVY